MRLPRTSSARPAAGSALAGDALGLSRLYEFALRLRDLFLVALAVVAVAVPSSDPHLHLVAAALLLVVLPYNLALRASFRRSGVVPSAMAWGDQVLAAGFVVLWPELMAPAVIAGMLDVAVAAVLLDRRAAVRAAVVGGVLFTAAVGVTALLSGAPSGAVLAAPAYAVSAFTTAWVVGTVSGRERHGQRSLGALLASLPVVVYEMDAETLEVRYVSPHIETISGRPASEFLGDPAELLGLVHRRDQALLLSMVADLSDGRQTHDTEYRVITADGAQRWVRNIASTELAPDGRRLLRGSIADITAQKQAELLLAHQACTDALTGLPNRARLLDLLTAALGSGAPHVLVFLDVDAFKRINDSLGHGAGDALLVHVGRRLRRVLREHDSVARLGGDEFVVLARLDAVDGASEVVARVQSAFASPFALHGRTMDVTASAGAVVVHPGAQDSAEALLQDADAAMYAAKRSGAGRSSFYDEALRTAAVERLELESELRRALDAQQFSVVYQPILRAADREVVGHEALVRWLHPERGLVSPADFVPVAEQTGQILELGRWVLREACLQARRWADASGRPLRMSVNLSARQLSDTGLVADVMAALEQADLPASALCLEITETALISNPGEALTALRELRDRGVTIALDDFGTGYSSLSHLHTYPVDTVKVDRSFVAQMGEAGGGIVSAILHLSQHMGLTVVAEGVETLEQAALLTELGCDLLQGYALGRPEAPAAAVPAPRREARQPVEQR